jgi:hypothetical protein
MKATNFLHRAMRVVYYCRIAMAIKMASKRVHFASSFFIVAMAHGGRRGNTEQVVA